MVRTATIPVKSDAFDVPEMNCHNPKVGIRVSAERLVQEWRGDIGNDAVTNSTLSAGGSVSRSQPRGGPAHHL